MQVQLGLQIFNVFLQVSHLLNKYFLSFDNITFGPAISILRIAQMVAYLL